MDHKEFEQALCKKLGTTPDKATPQALHSAIGDTVMVEVWVSGSVVSLLVLALIPGRVAEQL